MLKQINSLEQYSYMGNFMCLSGADCTSGQKVEDNKSKMALFMIAEFLGFRQSLCQLFNSIFLEIFH